MSMKHNYFTATKDFWNLIFASKHTLHLIYMNNIVNDKMRHQINKSQKYQVPANKNTETKWVYAHVKISCIMWMRQ